ncbi:hypothetical protein, conserved [Plasmodium gonderi]|uniref:Uncharacterized protein n=1 Tax=Plasmodium gonderi TaxID=77519 RepID=A0A1Y1JTX2_PLAGO|nr:hypothetical protein, conserved [Plasmodium gonderi]GAW83853.1 hypothetical protein, conserved [Plasmodium gonderi]
MNKQIVSNIIKGKFLEKKIIDKQIIKRNVEHIILHFNRYSEETDKCTLLKNIIPYTKNIFLDTPHLKHLYEHIIKPLLKNGYIDSTYIPNIVHTFKKHEKCNYILKELYDHIIHLIKEGKVHVHNDINIWIDILQVFSSKKRGINFVPLLRYIMTNNNNYEDNQYKKINSHAICAPGGNVRNEEANIQNDRNGQHYEDYKFTTFTPISLSDIHYKSMEILLPRTFCILMNVLSKVKTQCTHDSTFTTFLHENIQKILPQMNNIDLCQLIEALLEFKCGIGILFTLVDPEVFRRVTSFDIFQLSIIFHKLSKYWENVENKKLFTLLFMRKVKKYVSLYLLYNQEEKYILFTKNKASLIEIVPMFFLAYVKNMHSLLPHYFYFSKIIKLQFSILSKRLLLLKNNHLLFEEFYQYGNLDHKKKHTYMNWQHYQHYLNEGCRYSSIFRLMNQTISNLMYAHAGYLYNILTLQYTKEENILFIRHLFLTLNSIYELLSQFSLFYHNRQVIPNGYNFILPLHKSQLLIFLYTYWSFVRDLYFYLNNCKQKNIAQTADSFYFIKLNNVKKINFLLTTLDDINLNVLMKQTLNANNKFVSHIYTHVLNVVNNSRTVPHNAALIFHRRVLGPYTISELCR